MAKKSPFEMPKPNKDGSITYRLVLRDKPLPLDLKAIDSGLGTIQSGVGKMRKAIASFLRREAKCKRDYDRAMRSRPARRGFVKLGKNQTKR